MTKSWNIDIAAELEDYLSDLSDVQFTFDGGKTNLNFAEAALVIQGSACIYSRKVEFLYSLVYQTLDLITTRKQRMNKKKQASSIGEDGVDADVEFVDDDPALELIREDELDMGTDIDLDETLSESFYGGVGFGPKSNSSGLALLARTPLALIRTNTEIAGARMNAGAKHRASLEKFKTTSSMVHPSSGALILDLDEALALGSSSQSAVRDLSALRPSAPATTFIGAALHALSPAGAAGISRTLSAPVPVGSKLDSVLSMALQRHTSLAGKPGKEIEYGGAPSRSFGGGYGYGGGDDNDHDDDDHHDYGAGGGFDPSQFDDVTTEMHIHSQKAGGRQVFGRRHRNSWMRPEQTASIRSMTASTEHSHSHSHSLDSTLLEENDAWEPLDPHDASGGTLKAFKRGNTVRPPPAAPKGLAALTVMATRAQFGPEPKKLPGKLFKSLAHPEFATYYFAERAARRERWKAALAGIRGGEVDPFDDDPLEEEPELDKSLRNDPGFESYFFAHSVGDPEDTTGPTTAAAAAAAAATVATAGYNNRYEMIHNDEDEDDDGGHDFLGGGGDDIDLDEWESGISASGVPLGKDDVSALPRVLEFGNQRQQHQQNGSQVPQSYEDRCREHIAAYLAQAAAFASNTDLSRTVRAWQDRMAPKLKQETARARFDIGVYSEKVIHVLEDAAAAREARQDLLERDEDLEEDDDGMGSNNPRVVPFTETIEGADVSEISRRFLAILMLANAGNVTIHPGRSADPDRFEAPFGVELLSTTTDWDASSIMGL